MRSALRRRGELPPLVPFRELVELEDDIFQVFVDYISPCRIAVSNDPFEEVVEEQPNPCNITLYDCNGRVAASDTTNVGDDPSRIVVEFDYEMHFTMGADFDSTLAGLEGAILEQLATATGLADCPITAGVEIVGSRSLQEFPDLFDSLSSEPIDEKDLKNTECKVPVPPFISTRSTCQTMTGFLTAYMKDGVVADSSQEAFVRSALKRFVREGMQNDIYVTGDLRKASFIGDRTDEPSDGSAGLDGNNEVRGAGNGSGSGGLDSLGIILLCVGIVAVLAFAILALAFRRRRNADEKDAVMHEPSNVAADLDGVDPALYKQSDGFNQFEPIEGADIPGSLATTDFLALKKQEQERNGQDATQGGASSSSVTTGGAVVAASKNGGSKSASQQQRKKKRREDRRRKTSPSTDGCPSLDSIPEEESDDELFFDHEDEDLDSSY